MLTNHSDRFSPRYGVTCWRCKADQRLTAQTFEAARAELRSLGWREDPRKGGPKKAEWACPTCGQPGPTNVEPAQTTRASGLQNVDAEHHRVTCSCGATAELCAKRGRGAVARMDAVRRFIASGWHHDPVIPRRTQLTTDEVQRLGLGHWFCPTCAKATHL